MTTVSPRPTTRTLVRVRTTFRQYFSLREGQADRETIDQDIRGGVGLRGTNLWILMSAIFIASIGLDVNSTAVIIGAMLISPLMGPIMGLGYGIGIYDFALIRRSLKTLAVATLISLATSALYFSLSPLTGEHSELLARTSPSIWDVLIALFGGLVGMVGATRSEKTNVIPGVAIATALMPPLCTAGYGLAHGSLAYFAGAFYLFSINCVFIAFATVVVTWVIRAKPAARVDEAMQRRVRRFVLAAVVLTAVPSVILAYRLVTQEVFNARADQFIKAELSLPLSVVASRHIDPRGRVIEAMLVGRRVDQAMLDRLADKLPAYGLPNSRLVVRQAGDERIDTGALASSLKASIAQDLIAANHATRTEMDVKDQTIARLQHEIDGRAAQQAELARVARELRTQYPQIREILYGATDAWDSGASAPDAEPLVTFVVSTAKPLPRTDRQRIERWLSVRLDSPRVRVVTAG
ncbi:DUF389 domain-containing protein [Burkholderia cenocepacia]|uniref:DUF389 domain-containing protein n=1 Tax=Burkholderia cenocepacia TaxID=95486 RepID=UPI000F67D59D|nr:DUF389 domain-containing protein [Burkholderia cenocepacia]RSB80102.1 DUF389 domain-containing protein [Burkholderia cenocepacia]